MKKCILWGNWVSKRSRRDPDHEKTFLTFTLSVNKIILYQFSMFKSLDSIASVVGMFMYLTISKLKQVLRSWKGLGKVSTTTLVFISTCTCMCKYMYMDVVKWFSASDLCFYTRCWSAGHHFIGLRHFHCIKDNFVNFDCIKVNLEFKIPKRVVNGQPLRKLHQLIK